MAIKADMELMTEEVFEFYGVNTEKKTILLDGVTLKAEGSDLIVVTRKRFDGAVWFLLDDRPIARVRIEEGGEGYRMVDFYDDHVWLEFGSGPTFRYTPRKKTRQQTVGGVNDSQD